MKGLVVLAAGALMSLFLVASVNSASAVTAGNPQVQKSEKGGKKAMAAMREREQKVREVRKKGLAMRQNALYGKSGTQNKRKGV